MLRSVTRIARTLICTPVPTSARHHAHTRRVMGTPFSQFAFTFGRSRSTSPELPKRGASASRRARPAVKIEVEDDGMHASAPSTPAAKRKASTKARASVPEAPNGGDGPDGWRETLATIKTFRAQGPSAAVDTMGCEKIAELQDGETKVTEKYKRYLCLTSAMLSSQTRDEINHAAMRRLIAHGCTPENILATDEDTLDVMLNPVGFHRRKSQYLRATAKILLDEYDGDIPPSVETLCALPGVGPKMAYLVMNVGWEKPTGICVDVHVHRITERLGWTSEHAVGKNGSPRKKTPEDTRASLESWLPKEEWIEINPLLVGFGQLTCTPLRPKCGECPLASTCPSAFKEATPAKKPKTEV